MKKLEDKGLRFNEGKTRFDLLPPSLEEVAKVFTRGAEKYDVHNWQRGMRWSKVIASLKRHLAAYEKGEDFDKETGLYHLAHLATNALFLLEYYNIYPEGDDRQYTLFSDKKVGLDIDDVLFDFTGHYSKTFNTPIPEAWNFDRNISENLQSCDKDWLLSMPVKVKPEDIPFEPHCYITSRSVPIEWTLEQLAKAGFPTVPVYSIGYNASKVNIALESGIDVFVDDRYENFRDLNANGILTYLFDSPHNQRYDVGYKRIRSLKELPLAKVQ